MNESINQSTNQSINQSIYMFICMYVCMYIENNIYIYMGYLYVISFHGLYIYIYVYMNVCDDKPWNLGIP